MATASLVEANPVALVAAEIGRHSLRTGQLRHIEVQIHPVDAFQLQDDIFMLEFRDVFWQSHGGVWLGICYSPSLENTSRFDGSIRHSSRDAAMLLQPDTALSQRPKESHACDFAGRLQRQRRTRRRAGERRVAQIEEGGVEKSLKRFFNLYASVFCC
jgi:hypothetical protein